MEIHVETIKPKSGRHNATVIFFHGSGGTGSNIMERVSNLLGRNLEFAHIKVIYPTAPLLPYTQNAGQLSTVWFDRRSVNITEFEDNKSFSKSYDFINQLIDNEVSQGIPLDRIIVGGFSMGGAVALHTAYHLKRNLAGVFVCSSFLNRNSIVYKALIKSTNSGQLPDLLMFHGTSDPMVPLAWARECFDKITRHGVKGIFTELPNTLHELKQEELNELEKWILQKSPPLRDNENHVVIKNKL